MSKVFISYMREDNEQVRRLAEELIVHGIEVWLDKDKIKPGYRWQDAIKEGISQGDFFIACFSEEYYRRSKNYMNEELVLAIGELRQRPTDHAWFIPVLLSECEIPNRSIGAGETLRSIQWVELYKDWGSGIRQILSVIKPDLLDEAQIDIPKMNDEHWESLLYAIWYRDCIPLIGRSVCYGIVPTDSQIAREWSLKYGYISEGSRNLAEVADFIARERSLQLPKLLMHERLKSIVPPDFTNPDEPHAILAALPMPVYLTTNFNNFMEQALIARNKEPKREICRWHTSGLLKVKTDWDDYPHLPTESNPIVYHLFGHIEEPDSIVISRDDYLQFLMSVSSDPSLMPPYVRAALYRSARLYFGFRVVDEEFRFLSQIIGDQVDRHSRERITNGWQRGTIKEFATQLRKRWEGFTKKKVFKK